MYQRVPNQEGLSGKSMVNAKSKIFDVIALFRAHKTLPLGIPCKSCSDAPKVVDFDLHVRKKMLRKIF